MLQSLTKKSLQGVETALGTAYPKPIRFVAGYNIDYIIHLKCHQTEAEMTVRMTDALTRDYRFKPHTEEYDDCVAYMKTQKVVDDAQQWLNAIKQHME